MELGLGLRTCFSLETKDPLFVNFKLSPSEIEAVQKKLPRGFRLVPVRFFESDSTPNYWLSYNFYEIHYPKKELQAIKKVRCEINTFVQDDQGKKGIYVFCGSPYVSREKKFSILGWVCDWAERTVCFIYGCGRLIPLTYELGQRKIQVHFADGENRVALEQPLPPEERPEEVLSTDYLKYNDISFFNDAKTYDLVNVNSAFLSATFTCVDAHDLKGTSIRSVFLNRPPDRLAFHRGEITYSVVSMNSYERASI